MINSPRRMTLFIVILFFLVPVSSWGLTAGPDGFGYTCKDSTELSMPAFEWTDIDKYPSHAEVLVHKSDGRHKVFGPISIGFPFRFYGIEYRELYIASNGLVSFNPDIGIAWPETKSTFPFGGDGVNNLIAGLWALLNPGAT